MKDFVSGTLVGDIGNAAMPRADISAAIGQLIAARDRLITRSNVLVAQYQPSTRVLGLEPQIATKLALT
ncbi:hypothetical protein ACQR2B_04800 [Bradyrhizobium oligotrophicum]|uniref:hypothetical protein n=1 Tax=Bradyrhizobium TaxID=374 RepID=UPI003EC10982